MKQYWKDKWIKALRSGEYKQGSGGLKNYHDEFCCLGVLCDLVIKEKGTPDNKLQWEKSGPRYLIDSLSDYPSDRIYNYTGRTEISEYKLAELNDDAKYTFMDIANVIESGVVPDDECEVEYEDYVGTLYNEWRGTEITKLP